MATPAPLVLEVENRFLRETIVLSARPDPAQGLAIMVIQSSLGNESIGVPPKEARAFAALIMQAADDAEPSKAG